MGDTYSLVHIEKIKTYGALKAKYNHNLRQVDVDNADPEKAYLNESLVEAPVKENGAHMDFPEAVKDRINSLAYYKDRRIRSDAVLALEVLLTFTKDDTVDLEKWKQISQKWLHDTFDVAPDGKSNILSIEYHGDESGNVHIHALVCPIDEQGHLNAKRFTGGYRAMADLQASYGERMKPLGMKPGVAKSSATHKDIQKMYASLNEAKKLPEIFPGETAEQYRDRVREELETRFAVTYRKAEDYAVASRRSADQYANDVRSELHEEVDRERHVLSGIRREREEEELKIDSLKEESESIQEKINKMIDQMFILNSEMDEDVRLRENAEHYERIKKGISVIHGEDPALADWIESILDNAEQRSTELEDMAANYAFDHDNEHER